MAAVPERLDAILADARERRVDTVFLSGHAAGSASVAARTSSIPKVTIARL